MKKVNLDKEFEIWKNKNYDNLLNKFLGINNFDDFIEGMWRKYQDENGLIDKSNEIEFEDF